LIIAAIKMKGRSEKRKEISQTIQSLAGQVLGKKGCLDANSYQDINDENIFYLVEEWQTQQDLDDYLQSKLFAVLLGIKTILVESPEIKFMVESRSASCNERESVQLNEN